MRFGTVILAAGASTRMGRPKLLLPWGDKTILAHLIQQWATLGSAQIAAVIEPKSPLVPHLDVDQVVNPHPDLGMFSSVQCAARWQGWKKDITHFVITLGDQPHVGIGTLKDVISFAEKNPDNICQPARKGRGRHPVVLPRKYFSELATTNETNLKEFLRTKERKMFESDDAGLDLDLDTPDDYERALNIRRANSDALSS